jgi:hypothetical protein
LIKPYTQEGKGILKKQACDELLILGKGIKGKEWVEEAKRTQTNQLIDY